jgi:hypothetical protein
MRSSILVVIAVVTATATACGTTRTSPGLFVTDVRFVGDQLVTSRCAINYVTIRSFDHTNYELSEDSCRATNAGRFPVVPPQCVEPLARLQAASPADEPAQWAGLTPECRRYAPDDHPARPRRAAIAGGRS